jgi:hypothetical protein
MITLSYRTLMDHMDLKNWAISLFEKGSTLNTHGFLDPLATPLIARDGDSWTPDLIVWNKKIVLIIECKSGTPSEDDLAQAKSYVNIPQSLVAAQTGLSNFTQKIVLLYFKDKLESDPQLRDDLLGKLILEKDILVWTCERGFQITWVTGDHGDPQLNSLMKGGLPLTHLPPQQIEIQPDSPIVLLENLIFTKLWERAFRFRDTRFTIGTIREILEGHNYALEKDRDRKALDAIKAGEKNTLCTVEQTNQVWRLNVILNSPATYTEYLKKLRDIMTYPRLNEFPTGT